MTGIKDFSTTASSNANVSPINWQEGQTAASVNNSARDMMAAIKRTYLDHGGALTTAGTSNAYTITSSAGDWSAYAAGDTLLIKSDRSNTGAATLKVDGLDAANWYDTAGAAYTAGGIVANEFYLVVYDSTNSRWVTVASTAGDTKQVTPVATKAAFEAATIGSAELVFMVEHTAGTGKGASFWRRVSSEPSHALKIQSADSIWFEPMGPRVDPYIWGATGDGSTNDFAAVRDMFAAAAGFKYEVYGPNGDFRCDDTVTIYTGTRYFGAGAKFIRGWSESGYSNPLFINNNYDSATYTTDLYFDDIETEDLNATIDGHHFVMMQVRNVHFRGLRIVKKGGLGASFWAGEDLWFYSPYIRNTLEIFCDGLHFTRVKNCNVINPDIDTWDDAIALIADTHGVAQASFSKANALTTDKLNGRDFETSGALTITGGTLRSVTNSLRVSTWDRPSYNALLVAGVYVVHGPTLVTGTYLDGGISLRDSSSDVETYNPAREPHGQIMLANCVVDGLVRIECDEGNNSKPRFSTVKFSGCTFNNLDYKRNFADDSDDTRLFRCQRGACEDVIVESCVGFSHFRPEDADTTTGSSNTYAVTTDDGLTSWDDGHSYLIKANHTNTGAATLNVNSAGASDWVTAGPGLRVPTTAGSSNAYTVSTEDGDTSFTNGQVYWVKAHAANTAAATININGVGAQNWYKNASTPYSSGEISENGVYGLVYDSANTRWYTSAFAQASGDIDANDYYRVTWDDANSRWYTSGPYADDNATVELSGTRMVKIANSDFKTWSTASGARLEAPRVEILNTKFKGSGVSGYEDRALYITNSDASSAVERCVLNGLDLIDYPRIVNFADNVTSLDYRRVLFNEGSLTPGTLILGTVSSGFMELSDDSDPTFAAPNGSVAVNTSTGERWYRQNSTWFQLVGKQTVTVADDAVGTLTPPTNGGTAFIIANPESATPSQNFSAFLYYDVGSSLAIEKIGGTTFGTDVNTSTSNVTGTTGTDGKVTVAVQSGALKIENRGNFSITFAVTFF